MQTEIDGRTIAHILKGQDGEAMAAALVDCEFLTSLSQESMTSDSDPIAFVIERVDPVAETVMVRTRSGSLTPRPVQTGSVIPSEGLQALVDAHRDRLAAPSAHDIKTLREAGVSRDFSRDEAAALATVIRHPELPDQPARSTALNIMKRHRLQVLRIEIVRKWLRLVNGPVPLDLEIQTAWCQRKVGKPEAALRTLDRVLSEMQGSPGQQVAPLTQRAAVLLDLYDETRNLDYLARARQDHDDARMLAEASVHLDLLRNRLMHCEGPK